MSDAGARNPIMKDKTPVEIHKSLMTKLEGDVLNRWTLWWHQVKLMDVAVQKGQLQLVRWLLLHCSCPEHGKWCATNCVGSVAACEPQPGVLPSPLITAVKSKNLQLIELLLQHGGDVHDNLVADVGRGMNVFDVVCSIDDVDLLRRLRRRFHVSMDRDGRSLLHIACSHNAPHCARYLVQGLHYEQVNIADSRGMTPLMHAIRYGPDLPRMLIEISADINITTEEGSALHVLMRPRTHAKQVDVNLKDFLASVHLLVNHGAQVDLKSPKGCTPLVLIISRAEVNVRAANLRHAADGNQFDVVTLAAFKLILKHSHARTDPAHRALCVTAVMNNISEIFTYIRYANNHLHNAIACIKLNHNILVELLKSGFDTSTPANYGTRRRYMDDLSLMEAIITNLLVLSSTLSRQPVINQDDFIPIGNALLAIFNDYIDNGVVVRPGLLLNTLAKPHPRILPFTVLYMTRQNQVYYQKILSVIQNMMALTSRLCSKNLVLVFFRRVPSLTHLCRLTISHSCFKGRLCLNEIDRLDLPSALKEYLKFPIDIKFTDYSIQELKEI
ncbi:hypothetical protein CAPTEDRAFT_192205 [Capitella teleta]|uniref:SOCS box domain-containing protein n=1 Tax=Capitella teleta TaxID=283909 RepID=R7TN29_CAPTE|nr:hypothetical protein CAPTEDRAFT_192205 [Capitella teleta]|eukprot:ELT94927.1 hypothetical protein CAPTEDRAFT_192205 [Capitella teleta]